jgi:hypothetical protein
MSLDYLPIQASAVPSERVFSSSAETDTKKRNRISPVLMEALQMLKFALKKGRLNFTQDWVTSPFEMQRAEPEEGVDMLAMLLEAKNDADKQDDIDRILRDIAGGDHDGDVDDIFSL